MKLAKDDVQEWPFCILPHIETPGADAINISGLLVYESRLLNPKKIGNLRN
jgi:hypothetical protein